MFAGVATTNLAFSFLPSVNALGSTWPPTHYKTTSLSWNLGSLGEMTKSDVVLSQGQHGLRLTYTSDNTSVTGPRLTNSASAIPIVIGPHTDFLLVRTTCTTAMDGPWLMAYDWHSSSIACGKHFGYALRSIDTNYTQLSLGTDAICVGNTATQTGSTQDWHVIAFGLPATTDGGTYTTSEYLDGKLTRTFSSNIRAAYNIVQCFLGRAGGTSRANKYIDYAAILMYDTQLSDNDVATISQYLLETYVGVTTNVSWYLRNRNFTSTYTYTHNAAPPITPTFTYAVVRQNSSDIVWTINGQSHDFKLIQAPDPSTNINGTAIAEAGATQVAPTDLSSASYNLTGAGIGQSWIDLRLFDRLLRQDELTGLYTNIQAAFDGVSDGYSFQPITVTWSPDTWTFLQNTAIDTKTIQVTNGSLAWVAEAKTSLPSGLSFNGTDLTGTPTALGTTAVTWRVYTTRTDSSGNEHRIHFADSIQTLRVVTPITTFTYPALQVLRNSDFRITPILNDSNTTDQTFTWTDSPPSWATINSASGVIQGLATGDTTTLNVTLSYTATTPQSIQTTLTVTVLNEDEVWVAGALVYPENVQVTTSVPVEIKPSTVDLSLDTFSITPELPPTLTCHPQTGVISGTVSQSLPLTAFTVSATRTGFTQVVQATLALSVIGLFQDVVYPPLTAVPLRTRTIITPNVRGRLQGTFSTLQPLPAGLTLDPDTGALTVLINTYQDRLDVTCILTVAGTLVTELTPFVLEPFHPLVWTTSRRLAFQPNTDQATDFQASLPPGLHLNTRTGQITGNYESPTPLAIVIRARLGEQRAQGTLQLPARRKDLIWNLVWGCLAVGLGALILLTAILLQLSPTHK